MSDNAAPKYCPRPCRDCPFRADIESWQSPADAARNAAAVLREIEPRHCHHTTHRGYGYPDKSTAPESRWRICAGFILMTRNYARRIGCDYHPDDPGPLIIRDENARQVFDSIDDMMRAAYKSGPLRSRIRRWLDLQPPTINADPVLVKYWLGAENAATYLRNRADSG